MRSAINISLLVNQASRTTSFTDSANIWQPFCKSPCEIFRGGMNRMDSYIEVVRIRRPFSMHRFATRLARFFGADRTSAGSAGEYDGDANSTATIKPCPRISTIMPPTSGSSRRLCNDNKSSLELEIVRSMNHTYKMTSPSRNIFKHLLFTENVSDSHCGGA